MWQNVPEAMYCSISEYRAPEATPVAKEYSIGALPGAAAPVVSQQEGCCADVVADELTPAQCAVVKSHVSCSFR